MTSGEIAMTGAGFILIMLWILRHVLISRALHGQTIVAPDPAAPLPENPPPVTVLVAAKDEQDNIGHCLDSLQKLDYPNLEFIVIDDRSSDRTAEIVRARAADDSRLRLVQVRQLPDGWFGKPHAMQQGAAVAEGQWLLFVDADCRLSPGSVRAVVHHVLDQQGDMLSLWPSLKLHSFGEKLLMPVCGSLLAVYHRPEVANNPSSRTAFANGQFILIKRDVFRQIGGWQSVRSTLVEDIAFARHVKHSGYRALSEISRDIFSVRMYSHFRDAWRGWSRIFSGSFHSAGKFIAAMLLVIAVSFGPYVYAVAAIAGAAARNWQSTVWNGLAAMGLVLIAIMLTVVARFNRIANAPVRYIALHPLALTLMFTTLIKGFWIHLGWSRVRWRGNTYRGSANLTETATAATLAGETAATSAATEPAQAEPAEK